MTNKTFSPMSLSPLDAARILFGDEVLGDPQFDPSSPWRSGADVCESLASYFDFTAEDYAELARRFRIGDRVEVYEWETDKATGYLRKARTKTIGEVYGELRAVLGEYPDGGEEYFSVSVLADASEEWPEGDIVCFSVNGSSEGDYTHVEVHTNGHRRLVLLGKTFMGRDASWAFARRLADLLEIQ